MLRRTALLPALAALLLTAACGSGPGASGSASGSASASSSNAGTGELGEVAEGALVVYSGRNEALVGPLLEDFTEATGIPVTPRYGDSAELAAQLLEEGDATPAQVFFSQDAGALGALQDAGRLAQLDEADLRRVPADFRSTDGRWLGVSGRARVLVYNTEQVREADLPDSVFDLTGPAYEGKVAYAPTNASFQSFVTGMRVAAGEDRARQWLEDFGANEPVAYERNALIVDAVAEGEIPFGLVNHYYLHEKAAEAGGLDEVPARNHYFAKGDPGSLVNVAGVGVLAGKADDKTQAFVDFLLSRQAQEYFAGETFEYPLVRGVESRAEGAPALSEIENPDVDLSDLDDLQGTLELLDEVGLT